MCEHSGRTFFRMSESIFGTMPVVATEKSDFFMPMAFKQNAHQIHEKKMCTKSKNCHILIMYPVDAKATTPSNERSNTS